MCWGPEQSLIKQSNDEFACGNQSDDDCNVYVSTSLYVPMPLTVQRANFVLPTHKKEHR